MSTSHSVSTAPEHIGGGEEAVFPAPVRLPGRPDQLLSPLEFTALSERRRDPNLLGADWGLIEEKIDTIDKKGFQLFGRKYMHAALIPYTTGDKAGPRPTLVARYDRALAARGILEEVKVLEVLDSGTYKPLCLAVPREKFSTEAASRAEFFAFRREYVNVLVAKRKLAEREVLALRDQDRELKAFFDEQKARSRKKPRGAREVSAQPITLEDLREKSSQLGTELQNSDAFSVSDQRPGKSKSSRGGAEPPASPTPVEDSTADGLGSVLGGAVGFASDQDE